MIYHKTPRRENPITILKILNEGSSFGQIEFFTGMKRGTNVKS